MPFQPGNREGLKATKAKPFRDALRLAIAEAGEDHKRLRRIADSLLTKAEEGDVSAIREVADRLDGKVATPLVGDRDEDPIQTEHYTDEQRIAALERLFASRQKSE